MFVPVARETTAASVAASRADAAGRRAERAADEPGETIDAAQWIANDLSLADKAVEKAMTKFVVIFGFLVAFVAGLIVG